MLLLLTLNTVQYIICFASCTWQKLEENYVQLERNTVISKHCTIKEQHRGTFTESTKASGNPLNTTYVSDAGGILNEQRNGIYDVYHASAYELNFSSFKPCQLMNGELSYNILYGITVFLLRKLSEDILASI